MPRFDEMNSARKLKFRFYLVGHCISVGYKSECINVGNFLVDVCGLGPNVTDHRAGVAGSGASPCWADFI